MNDGTLAGDSAERTFDQLTPEQALEVLRRRGSTMSEDEREAYIRRAIQAVNSADLADRLLSRVPELRRKASSRAAERSEIVMEIVDKTG